MKVLSVCQYDGEYDGRKYTKAMLVVSKNGGYPQLISVDPDIYNKAVNEAGGKLLGKEIDVLYSLNYGKYKATEIKLI